MKLRPFKIAVVASTLGIALWTSAATLGTSESVEYKFREAPLNALGLQSIDELRGTKPIVIDFWGKN